jgi:hypothetical protein
LNDRKAGLACLRRQLTGDELLVWTIETFTMFYEKTWAQSVMFPLFGLIPLFFSIFTFVYDYYSDFELSYEYYHSAFINPPNSTISDKIYDEKSVFIHPNEMVPKLCQFFNSSHLIFPSAYLQECAQYWLQTHPTVASTTATKTTMILTDGVSFSPFCPLTRELAFEKLTFEKLAFDKLA